MPQRLFHTHPFFSTFNFLPYWSWSVPTLYCYVHCVAQSNRQKNKIHCLLKLILGGARFTSIEIHSSALFYDGIEKRIKSHLSHDNHRWNLHVINLFECWTGTRRDVREVEVERTSKKKKEVSTFTPHYEEMIACNRHSGKKKYFCLFMFVTLFVWMMSRDAFCVPAIIQSCFLIEIFCLNFFGTEILKAGFLEFKRSIGK